ncbi:SGNH/GDSL hydrolase family protein [Tamlana sp. 2201CG12-4]|uniref:SGNH/GDSL hydrolase family protein n=1 Tax=Tamlana sp. 2201CG12-4 TaxID=3112582 RepID=UPI002DBED76A|nr:SGNH/GDSL hydrolase family protein [Tamlana sp. 2201CG12-4]MEC3906267.1 SGNH/GDSL hydrolase family protein [Tamlana sp. 2201CG12-4]
MKHTIIAFFTVLSILTISCTKTSQQLPLHNKKVLILGNSITQNGQYVDFMEYYLRKHYPEQALDIISIGLSSETVSGDSEQDHPFPRPCIHTRLDDALTATTPDLVLACYGMNDGIFSAKGDARFNNYKKGIKDLKTKVENTGAKLILLTPTPFDPDPVKHRVAKDNEPQSYKRPYYNYNQVLKGYADWLTGLNGTKTIDLHSYLSTKLEALKTKYPDSTFIPDAVHPDQSGHFYMAKKVLQDLYPEIIITDPTSEINSLKKDSLFVLVSKRRQIRSDGWRNYIGYSRGKVVKSNDIAPTITEVNTLDIKIRELLH